MFGTITWFTSSLDDDDISISRLLEEQDYNIQLFLTCGHGAGEEAERVKEILLSAKYSLN